MNERRSPLVSVITPVYNAERFISDTIKSVQSQSYDDWELLLIDDCSTDNSVDLIREAQSYDQRIRLVSMQKNSGAGASRNKGIIESKGDFLTFLDADDLWDRQKLSKQVKFMVDHKYAFTFTDYYFADADGNSTGKRVFTPSMINYRQSLKNPIIWTSTVMLDASKIKKEIMMMPDVRRGQDAATWWKILKVIDYAYSVPEVFAYYRRTNKSLSANKLKAIRRTWFLYRKVEGLHIAMSIYMFIHYSFNAVRKRI